MTCASIELPAPLLSLSLLPKQKLNVMDVEIDRFALLFQSELRFLSASLSRAKSLCSYFQDDLFPSALTGQPAITASQWLDGKNAEPVRLSLQPEGVQPASQRQKTKKVSD